MDAQTDERDRLEQLRAELRRRGWNATLVQGEQPILRVQNPVVGRLNDTVVCHAGVFRWEWAHHQTISRAGDVAAAAEQIMCILREVAE